MRRGVRAIAITALIGVALACGTTKPTPTDESTVGASPAATTGPSGNSPPVTLPPLDPAVVGVTCDGRHAFDPALLARPGAAERDRDPAAAALRAELRSSAPESDLPHAGWTRVIQLPDEVHFVARNASDTGWSVAAFELRNSAFVMAMIGGCRLAPRVPGGMSIAVWWLDPAFPRPRAIDTSIHVLLVEQACASGGSPEGRVLPPVVATREDAVVVTLVVGHVPGGADCPGNPTFAMTVDLPDAIGSRALLDGGVYPPRDATTKPEDA